MDIKNNLRCVLALSAAVFIAACGAGREVSSGPVAQLPVWSGPQWTGGYPESLQPLQGYFSGSTTIDTVVYDADALITADGLVRMRLGGSSAYTSTVTRSMQFIGEVTADASQASGTGTIVGQGCALVRTRFCDELAPARIEVWRVGRGSILGKIEVVTSNGHETWPIELHWPVLDTYLEPATIESAKGLYEEHFAEFAPRGDTVTNVDAAGRLFFQSPASGCVGNGTLTPHSDGAVNVYDVTLSLAACNSKFAHLDGEYQGLATRTAHCPDEGCTWLVIYLTSMTGPAPGKAIALKGNLL